MKRLILILLFLIALVSSISGQRNTLYITYAPADLGIGIRYDHEITDLGVYCSASWGNYRFDDKRINNHVKLVAGIIKYVSSKYYDYITILYSAGISYHHYGEKPDYVDERVFFPLSIDLGTGVKIKWFNAGFCFDFIKGEGTVNFGYSF